MSIASRAYALRRKGLRWREVAVQMGRPPSRRSQVALRVLCTWYAHRYDLPWPVVRRDARTRKARDLYRAGMTWTGIARKLGYKSEETVFASVRCWARKRGLPEPTKRRG